MEQLNFTSKLVILPPFYYAKKSKFQNPVAGSRSNKKRGRSFA
jgi:hypothetical protein